MDYNRIYKYRFKDVDKQKKLITWQVIADFLYKELNYPALIIDPAPLLKIVGKQFLIIAEK